MIYQVTYKDKTGNPLLETTFSAEGPLHTLLLISTTPSLRPPKETVSIGGWLGHDHSQAGGFSQPDVVRVYCVGSAVKWPGNQIGLLPDRQLMS